MRHRHVARGETQLNVMQTLARGVFHILISHATAGIKGGQHFYAPVQLRKETHQIGFVGGNLHVWQQCFKRLRGKGKIKLTAKIENGLCPNVAVQVAMNIS